MERENRTTVQRQPVNLAHAEPCLIQGAALFFAGPSRMRTQRLRAAAPAAKRAIDPQETPRLRPDDGGPSPSGTVTGHSSDDERMKEKLFLQTKPTRPKPAAARINASTAPGAGPRPCRRCARGSKMRTGFEKCASWKIPMIPSKMRTLFQDAHLKLRIFAECS
jgi:hypothetical protein